MAETRSSSRDGKDLSRRRSRKQCSPLKSKKDTDVRDRRVYLGLAFEEWRAMKTATGMRTDADLAVKLLQKRRWSLASSPSPPRAGDEKIRFSQSEVEALIKQEVHNTVKEKETKLQELVKELDFEDDFETSLQKLETRIDTITKRAEEALVCMTEMQKKQSQLPSVVSQGTSMLDLDEAMETESHGKSSVSMCAPFSVDEKTPIKSEEFFQEMETSKKVLKDMHADNKALTAAIADLSKELLPPPTPPPVEKADSSFSGSQGLVPIIKKEPEDLPLEEAKVEEPKQCEEPKPYKMKEEVSTPVKSTKHSDSEQDKFLYPPLPPTTFPSILSMEAASYNIPQRPMVHLALIRKPPGLSVLWNVAEKDPSAPPMDSYSVYMTAEKVKGGGVFRNWNSIGTVSAIPLPMCVMVSKYKPGHKVCVAVVGKDKFGRYGPYSKVVTAAIPE